MIHRPTANDARRGVAGAGDGDGVGFCGAAVLGSNDDGDGVYADIQVNRRRGGATGNRIASNGYGLRRRDCRGRRQRDAGYPFATLAV